MLLLLGEAAAAVAVAADCLTAVVDAAALI
jgi:hypothetical protein